MKVRRGGAVLFPGNNVGDLVTWDGNKWVPSPPADQPDLVIVQGDTIVYQNVNGVLTPVPVSSLLPLLGTFLIAPRAGSNADDVQGISGISIGGTQNFHTPTNASGVYADTLPARRFITAVGANSDAGYRGGAGQLSTQLLAGGPNAAGFEVIIRATPAVAAALGSRLFIGVSGGATTPCVAEPSVALNNCFYGWDSTDANWHLMHNDGAGAATKIDTGALHLEMVPVEVHIRARNGEYRCSLTQLGAGGVRTVLHSLTVVTDIPAAATLCGVNMTIGNAALGVVQEIRPHHISGRFGL